MNERRWLFLIIGLALALRLALWWQPLHQPANDEIEYVAVARDLVAGRGWQFYDHYRWLRAPLYPLFLAGSLWLANGDLHRAALPNLLLSVANVVLAFWLARALLSRRAALLAAAMTAMVWTNATFASLYMVETLFTTLFSVGLLIVVRASLAPPGEVRYRVARVAFAGFVFGLVALARSAVLLFLPILAFWVAYTQWPVVPRSRLLLLLAVFGLAVAAPIMPWTLRNARAYGKPILIETGLSYNLWAFNEPREDLDAIHRTLEAIPNPAERADYATARGLERLREDPSIVLRKLWPNWVFLARVKPIQDRFLMENYYDSVDLPLFVAALIFDDALYIVIALTALVGLAVHLAGPATQSSRSAAWLSAAWCAYLLGTFALTHGEARYRHFLFPVVIPYAAWTIVQIVDRRPWLPHAAWQRAVLAGLSLVYAWTIVTSYPRDWAAENLARGWYSMLGDIAVRAGSTDTALADYERAAASQRVPDPLLRLGIAAQHAGRTDLALDAFRRAVRLNPIYEPSAARLGDLLRSQGEVDAARRAFQADYLDQQRMLDWSWRELQPAPLSAIDLGDGLDYGYLSGFYPAEQIRGASARWTGEYAAIRLRPGVAHIVRLRMAAPRPDAQIVPVTICAGSRCAKVAVGGDWRVFEMSLPPGDGFITMRAPAFPAADGRRLGVMLDWIEAR